MEIESEYEIYFANCELTNRPPMPYRVWLAVRARKANMNKSAA